MKMFDSLLDESGDEWQTQAYRCSLDVYGIGDALPPPTGAPDDYQVEVVGCDGPWRSVDAFATVRRGRFVDVGVDRNEALPLLGYSGNLIAEATS